MGCMQKEKIVDKQIIPGPLVETASPEYQPNGQVPSAATMERQKQIEKTPEPMLALDFEKVSKSVQTNASLTNVFCFLSYDLNPELVMHRQLSNPKFSFVIKEFNLSLKAALNIDRKTQQSKVTHCVYRLSVRTSLPSTQGSVLQPWQLVLPARTEPQTKAAKDEMLRLDGQY